MSSDHMILCDNIHDLIKSNPVVLLPCHCHLLTQDFHSLGSSATIQRQIWVALMKSALSAAAQVALGHFTPGSLAIFNQTPHPLRTCRASNHSQHMVCNQPPAPRCPCQQTLPASFWVPNQPIMTTTKPHDEHTTDLTGVHCHLHCKKEDRHP
jgi:hypothetical protein